MDTGRGDEKLRHMERVTWKLRIPYVKQIDSQREFAVWLRKLKQGLCINLEGGVGREMGGGSKERGYMYTYGWFMLRFDRKQQNSVQQLSFNKK